MDYQINIVSKEHFNTLIYSGPQASKPIYLYVHDNHSLLARNIVTLTRKATIKSKTISVAIRVSCVILKIVPLPAGCFVKTAIDILKTKNVLTDIKREWTRNDRFVHPS